MLFLVSITVNLALAMRKNRIFKRTLLIVCEGKRTEPQYFTWLVDNISYPNAIWSNVDIKPKDIIADEKGISATSELGRRQKRKFQNPNKRQNTDLNNEMEDLFIEYYGEKDGTLEYNKVKANPVRYVAFAQVLNDYNKEGYDEIWAVFDKDEHPAHEAAFQLAAAPFNNKKVSIAFSSRSFEQWILLHFEQSKRSFAITECKNPKGKSMNCDDTNGCLGEVCLVGHIRKKYLPYYAKSNSPADLNKIMTALYNKQQDAFDNALWLQEEMASELKAKDYKIYLLNPYSTADLLVKKLIEL